LTVFATPLMRAEACVCGSPDRHACGHELFELGLHVERLVDQALVHQLVMQLADGPLN
jgi:hypothetical protein